MTGLWTIAHKEWKTASRDLIFLTIVSLFVILSVLSAYIGSSTKNAEMQAYRTIVQILKSQGASVIPDPPVLYPLSILRNIVTYVGMIGAVVAIFLGFETFSGERGNGTLKLVAVRPVYRDQIVTGKLLGGALVIGVLLSVILVFNMALFSLISGTMPGAREILRLLAFILISFLYMMLFYIASMLVSQKTDDSAFGFMFMMIVWLVVSFVLPQLADSQKSFAYAVNAAAQTITQIPSDTPVSSAIAFFSPAAQFEIIGNDMLQAVPETANTGFLQMMQRHAGSFAEILLPGVLLLLLNFRAAGKEKAV